MHATITNIGNVPVPLYSTQDKGFAYELEETEAYEVHSEAVTVVSVGDNPTFSEEVGEAIEALLEAIATLVMFWKRKQPEADPALVTVLIDNKGPNGLRVLLGSNVNEVQVAAGETYAATAPEYVEIRELGV